MKTRGKFQILNGKFDIRFYIRFELVNDPIAYQSINMLPELFGHFISSPFPTHISIGY